MHSMTTRLLHAICGLAMLATASVKADTSYTADFTSPTLDPGLRVSMLQEGVWTPGVFAPWSVGTGDGYLSLFKGPTPGNSEQDGPHVQTNFGTTGDFIATVTTDSTFNGNNGAGFFLDINGGYTGISFGTGWLNDAAGNGFTANGYWTEATPLLTLQIKRAGSTLTKSYKLDGQSDFTIFSTLSSDLVLGTAIFDLTNYGHDVNPTGVLFNSFTITPVPEPGTYAMLLMGLASVGLMACRRNRRNNAA